MIFHDFISRTVVSLVLVAIVYVVAITLSLEPINVLSVVIGGTIGAFSYDAYIYWRRYKQLTNDIAYWRQRAESKDGD